MSHRLWRPPHLLTVAAQIANVPMSPIADVFQKKGAAVTKTLALAEKIVNARIVLAHPSANVANNLYYFVKGGSRLC